MEHYNIDTNFFVNDLEDLFKTGPNWHKLKTRTSTRNVLSMSFQRIIITYFLFKYCFKILELGSKTVKKGRIFVPLELFICYYKDGNDSCPIHKHNCEQITLSFGESRIIIVNNKKILLKHGDVLYLKGQKHGIPKDENIKNPRISFNLFFVAINE